VAAFSVADKMIGLIEYFTKLGKHDGTLTVAKADKDTVMNCAFNFPAVLLVAGPSYWVDRLQKIHHDMVTDSRWKVRKSLAHSIHECAKILGSEVTERDLLPILFHLLQDIPEVAEGALQHLPEIL
jgi:hypothetical protein